MISVVPMLAILTTAAELRQGGWERLSVGETFAITGTVTTAMDRDNPDHTAYAIMDTSGCTYAKSTDKISLDESEGKIDLTPRQREVLESITRGLSNDDIATMLSISKVRVKQHLASLYEKLGASNRAEAVAIACANIC